MSGADDDFGPLDYGDTPEATSSRSNVVPMFGDDGIVDVTRGARLLLNTRGNAKKNVHNIISMLTSSKPWRGKIGYDEFREAPVKLGELPVCDHEAPRVEDIDEVWTEEDSVRAASWLCKELSPIGFDASPALVNQAISVVAQTRSYHPVREYLRALKWDGHKRLDTFLERYFGVDATTPDARFLAQELGKMWLTAAVARVMQPGCQVDTMLVFESARQGKGKSTGLRELASYPWFSESKIDLGNKDSYQILRGVWIFDWAELSALRSAKHAESIKAFVSSRSDRYRESYGRRAKDFKRQCVFTGTTNKSQYLVDKTGNRRFWSVKICDDARVDVDAIREDRDQLWAEAYQRFEAGCSWHVTDPELERILSHEQRARVYDDPWGPIVREWLKSPRVPDGAGGTRIIEHADGIEPEDVLLGAIGMRPGDMRAGDVERIGEVLRELGWVRVRVNDERERAYYRVE